MFDSFVRSFYLSFIEENRWRYIVEGLGTTLLITVVAVIIGIALGFLVAVVRSTHERTGGFRILNRICGLYLMVIRGTPVVVQLMIIFFIVLTPFGVGKLTASIIAFGINSGAYVAEIVRSGIMSIDRGQFEAGRSLGMSDGQTMRYIILPQALRNILPALGNEFIVLFKETSVAGYIGTLDLTKAGDILISRTYEAFFPLITVALIYLVFVVGMTYLLRRFERRLRQSER